MTSAPTPQTTTAGDQELAEVGGEPARGVGLERVGSGADHERDGHRDSG